MNKEIIDRLEEALNKYPLDSKVILKQDYPNEEPHVVIAYQIDKEKIFVYISGEYAPSSKIELNHLDDLVRCVIYAGEDKK